MAGVKGMLRQGAAGALLVLTAVTLGQAGGTTGAGAAPLVRAALAPGGWPATAMGVSLQPQAQRGNHDGRPRWVPARSRRKALMLLAHLRTPTTPLARRVGYPSFPIVRVLEISPNTIIY